MLFSIIDPQTSPGIKTSYVHFPPPTKTSMKTVLGDLEILLIGLHLMELIPVFQDQKIEASEFNRRWPPADGPR